MIDPTGDLASRGGRSPARSPYVLTIAATLVSVGVWAATAAPPEVPQVDGPQNLDALLEPIRARHEIPALGAAVLRGDVVVAVGVTGVRKQGSEVRAGQADSFHIGSCTKSMTATLCAILVEQGRLSWDSTIAGSFPDLRDRIKSEYHPVTLRQLLCHRGGLSEDRVPDSVFIKLRMLTGDMRQQRLKLVELTLQKPPAAAPGTSFIYSNGGYAIAGAMAEQATGESWEDLMRRHLFVPLGMKSAGFGPPGTGAELDQPRGHLAMGEKLVWVEPGPSGDNPAVIGPAGTVHCSLADWGRYASLHLAGANGRKRLLSAASFEVLHGDPFDQGYSFGWGMPKADSDAGRMLFHDGSNGLWYARIRLAADRDLAILVASNSASPRSVEAVGAVTAQLVERFEGGS